MLLPLVLILAAADVPIPIPASAALAEADAHFARRAEGASGGTAVPAETEAAIVDYRRAVVLAPTWMEARTRLLRALFFRGGFCGASQEEGRVAFEEARDVANEGLAQIERRLGNLSGPARIAALRTIPGAARLHFWAAISWGQWALHRNKIVAARAGAAGKVRDLATTVVDLDPQLEQGGGYMLLGRLHDQAPWIPFLTGWVSHQQGLVYLRQALEIGPQNTVNQYFLAEAILRHDRAHRDEARRLLLQCANASPRRDFEVEDAHYAEFARRRLADLK